MAPRRYEYIRWTAHHRRTVNRVLQAPLRSKDEPSGVIYLYTQSDAPGFVKIGMTSDSIRRRFGTIKRRCGYTPRLLWHSPRTSNARRVEQLVFAELGQYRHRQKHCVCGLEHTEWFQVKEEIAKNVIREWCYWFQQIQPYDESGNLHFSISDGLEQLEIFGDALTANRFVKDIGYFRHTAATFPQSIHSP